MLELARTVAEPAVDVTYVFYAREEVAAAESGLLELLRRAPRPARGRRRPARRAHRRRAIEAGLPGHDAPRGHPGGRAGPHRPALDGPQRRPPARAAARPLDAYEPERQPVIEGCEYREALQAVRGRGRGGRQRGARPGRARAQPPLRPRPHARPRPRPTSGRCSPRVLEDGDTLRGRRRGRRRRPRRSTTRCWPRWSSATTWRCGPSWAGPTWPASPRRGVPAANFGPGDATLAHTAGECVEPRPTSTPAYRAAARRSRRAGASMAGGAPRLRAPYRRSRRAPDATQEQHHGHRDRAARPRTSP